MWRQQFLFFIVEYNRQGNSYEFSFYSIFLFLQGNIYNKLYKCSTPRTFHCHVLHKLTKDRVLVSGQVLRFNRLIVHFKNI